MSIFVLGVIDPAAEKIRLNRQKENIFKQLGAVEAKLNNENFINRAKPEVVGAARDKYTELKEQLKAVEAHLADL